MPALTRMADAVGRGLVAGAAGTAAMTLSSTLEARLRGRRASTAPARATQKVLGIAAWDTQQAEARWNDLSHWGYGTGWGIVRGLLGLTRIAPARASAAHGAAVWGAAQVTLPALEVAPPSPFWGWEEVAIDALHHAVYAAATGLAFARVAQP